MLLSSENDQKQDTILQDFLQSLVDKTTSTQHNFGMASKQLMT